MARDTDYIASDVHLGAVPKSTERAFLRFLEHAGANARSVLLVGDLFDFWFEWGGVVPGKYFRVLSALAEVVDAGVPVTLIGGNHDAWGGAFLRDEVGVSFHPDTLVTELGGRRTLVAHGDGLGRGDHKYRVLKAVIRSRPAILGFRLLHPEIGMRIAGAASTTEVKAQRDEGARSRARYIEEWAVERIQADPSLEMVVCGHSHAPVIREVASGRHYVNSGDWIRNLSYVTVRPGEPPVMRRWTE